MGGQVGGQVRGTGGGGTGVGDRCGGQVRGTGGGTGEGDR